MTDAALQQITSYNAALSLRLRSAEWTPQVPDSFSANTARAALDTLTRQSTKPSYASVWAAAQAVAQAEINDRASLALRQQLGAMQLEAAMWRDITLDDTTLSAAWTYLRTQLTTVLTTVSGLTTALGGATTAAGAIAVGGAAITAFSTLDAQVATYEQIRGAQVNLYSMSAAFGPGHAFDEIMRRTGHLTDAIDTDEFWQQTRTSSLQRTSDADWRTWLAHFTPTTWTLPQIGAFWPDRGEHKWADLLWVAARGNAWIPDAGTLLTAHSAALTATKPAPSGTSTTPLAAARDTYYATTGATPYSA